jgi:hypothetical protein
MTILTPDKIARYALGAGFGITDGITATAIAIAESGGDPKQQYVTDREDSRGLWQINTKAHPEYASQNLYDPGTNAKAAFAVYQSSGWKAWTTYGGARYYLARVSAIEGMAVAKTLGPLVDPVDAAVGDALGGAKDAISTAQGAVGFLQDLENPQIWLRATKMVLGGLLILVGIRLALEKAAAPVVKKAASVAKVVAK